MNVLEFYNLVREKYPNITEKADKEHIRIWGEIDTDFAYSWFESLANAINKEMVAGVKANEYLDLFTFIDSHFQIGDDELKDCIDVAFTENLFWEVPVKQKEPFWNILPERLKELYINFHQNVYTDWFGRKLL